jgi:hypothetical protein
MEKPGFSLIFLCTILFIMTACEVGKKGDSVMKTPYSVTQTKEAMIAPNRSYEDCIELLPGQTMEYSFTSTRPVDFNIHYHGEDRVHYPVNKKNISQLSGEIKVDRQRYYTEEQEFFCLMWRNPHNTQVGTTCDISIK